MLDTFDQWIGDYLRISGIPAWVTLAIGSIALAVFSIVITMLALVRIPKDYFRGAEAPRRTRHLHPVLRGVTRILRNMIGWAMVLVGVVLSLPGVPGQGLLTILLGLMLVEFPGRRKLEKRLVRWPRIRRPLDALRLRFGQPPLELDED